MSQPHSHFAHESVTTGLLDLLTSARVEYGECDSEEEEFAKLREIRANIRSMYEAGQPLYSKDRIRFVLEQMEKPLAAGQHIHVPALDGNMVPWTVRTGQEFDVEDGVRFVCSEPQMSFLPIQRLLADNANANANASARKAYCSISISHYIQARSESTGEILRGNDVKYRTLEEAKALLASTQQDWVNSKPGQRLRSTLLKFKIPCAIYKIVGFALASFATHGIHGERWLHSLHQHACLLSIREVLAETSPGLTPDFTCLVQDPAYTDADKEALRAAQVETVDSPEGFLAVDDASVVMAIGSDVPVKQVVLEIARPAIIIWSTPHEHVEDTQSGNVPWADPNSSRTTKILESQYDALEFLGGEDMFDGTTIFVRRAVPPENDQF